MKIYITMKTPSAVEDAVDRSGGSIIHPVKWWTPLLFNDEVIPPSGKS